MGKYYNTFKKGTLELLFLKLLSQQDLYGYELASMINHLSENLITINAGNMYPTLYKLEDKGFITSYEKVCGRRMRRVYYKITENGKKELQEMMDDYQRITEANNTILTYDFEQEKREEIS